MTTYRSSPNSYKVGDRPWCARFQVNKETRVPCPVCFGKREVVLTLGNDDQVTTPCSYCALGYEAPRGWVLENQPYAAAKQVVITSVTITETNTGQERQYHSDSFYFDSADLFDTEAGANARAAEKAEAYRVERETVAKHIKGNVRKSFAWNVGYHLREIKKLKEQIERHERYAVLCKERAVDNA